MLSYNLVYAGVVGEDVDFVDDEDDLLAPAADEVQKGALRLAEWPVAARHEQHLRQKTPPQKQDINHAE